MDAKVTASRGRLDVESDRQRGIELTDQQQD